MSIPPRTAVVGAGLIGRRHAALVKQHGRLAAIVDPSEAARAFAAECGAPWFGDLGACLASAPPDAAIIATPNQLHARNALDCIAAGVPVLVEKPITDTTASAMQVVEASERAGVPVLVGHHRRHNPLIAVAREAIEAGRLGRVTLVNGQFWLYKPDDYYAEVWRRQKGAGPVFINLIHDIDLLRHLCGEIARVEARHSNAARGLEVEDTAAILLEFESGALGTVSVTDSVVAPWSWEFASAENPAYPRTNVHCYMIGGSHGSLSVPDLQLWTQAEPRSWWNPILSEHLHYERGDPLVRQLKHFAEVVEGKAEPLVSARDGMRTLAVVEAISISAETGEPAVPQKLEGE